MNSISKFQHECDGNEVNIRRNHLQYDVKHKHVLMYLYVYMILLSSMAFVKEV
jgi:hypothetical protein